MVCSSSWFRSRMSISFDILDSGLGKMVFWLQAGPFVLESAGPDEHPVIGTLTLSRMKPAKFDGLY